MLLSTLSVFIVSLWLSGCAHAPAQPALPQDPAAAWPIHRERVKAFQHFLLKGRLGIIADRQAKSASMLLKQKDQHRYQLRLTGPLGQGAVHVVSQPGHVVALTADGKRFVAHSAKALLWDNFHWALPIDKAYYWLRGLPASNSAKIELDAVGRLKQLQEGPWHIQFLHYQYVSGQYLPEKIKVNGEQFQLKIVKMYWEINKNL